MRYLIDHDLHIHSHLSICSKDPSQTPERILAYAVENGLKQICLTDHYWDRAVPCAVDHDFYATQDFEHIHSACPLPQSDGVEFLFGCEADVDGEHHIGVPASRYDDFDFIIVPTTHLHMMAPDCKNFDIGYRVGLWIAYLETLLASDLPFHKVGIAHLACYLINHITREDYIKTLDAIPAAEIERLMKKVAALGAGIELNGGDLACAEHELESVLRIFRIAKACGCKFYLGSDVHKVKHMGEAIPLWERAITLLDLTEDDKFRIKR
ncbi:MAG: PHP domain-containing protein [Clostridia bacterium]|nr:PHP domain-containing protein [Clostridia bacterium]